MFVLKLTDLETGKSIEWTPTTEEQEIEVATILMGLLDCPSRDLNPETPFGQLLADGPDRLTA